MESRTHDVIVVGASVAGCAAAMLYARAGLRVALFERRRRIDASKTFCTHFIQSSATPTLERLGLTGALEDAGAVRNRVRLWTRWGWIRESGRRHAGGAAWGYSIRRRRFDPILREAAVSTPGVDFHPGSPVGELLRGEGRVTGVRVDRRGESTEARAPLVVGADGCNSRVAELADVDTRITPNNRIGYFSYYRDVVMKTGTESQMWFLDPDVAYAFPNDAGITILAWLPSRTSPVHPGEDPDRDMRRIFSRLPMAPDLRAAEALGPPMVMKRLANQNRTPREPGLAFIGDAGMVTDPLWGSGLGFALQSAEWLADATSADLAEGRDPAPGVETYRQQQRERLGGYEGHMADYARARRFRLRERLLYAAATRDPVVADTALAYGSRNIGKRELYAPGILLRMLGSGIRARAVSDNPVSEHTLATQG